eukprot:scaffold50291_cov20-Tisochrysis_lutea.AAC.4
MRSSQTVGEHDAKRHCCKASALCLGLMMRRCLFFETTACCLRLIGWCVSHGEAPVATSSGTLTVALDTAQYQLDMNHMARVKGAEDMYGTFNLLVRRKAKENNFKPVLESIRDLMNEDVIIPPWLRDIFL